MSGTEPDFEVIDAVPTVIYGENLNQGHDMLLGARIKLALPEMKQLKDIIDHELNDEFKLIEDIPEFNIETDKISHLRIHADNSKLKNIPVAVDVCEKRILVKVGPCDLSGVGGHIVREQMIKNLVNQALQDKGLSEQYAFKNVNVSACVGVRGRWQMFKGFFFNNRERAGSHMNAYVKTDNDAGLTHWEPRKGPQRFFNDTICAMVTSTTTSLFEKGIRDDSIQSSSQATKDILKNPILVDIFDNLLRRTKERVTHLISEIKEVFKSPSSKI